MAGIFAYDTAAQLSESEFHAFACVVLQCHRALCRGLLVEICIGCVGYNLVLVARYEEIAGACLGIHLVVLLHLFALVGPAFVVFRLLHYYGNSLGKVVVQLDGHWYRTVAACLLQIPVVVHPLSVAGVERVVLLVQPVIKAAPRGIFVLIAAACHVVYNYNLGAVHHFLARGDVHGAVGNLAEHVYPHLVETGETAPVAACVSVDVGCGKVLEVFGPYKLGAVPYGSAIDTGLLHNSAYSGCIGIFAAVVLAEDSIECSVPSAVVVAHTVVLGQSGDERRESDTLVVIET